MMLMRMIGLGIIIFIMVILIRWVVRIVLVVAFLWFSFCAVRLVLRAVADWRMQQDIETEWTTQIAEDEAVRKAQLDLMDTDWYQGLGRK